jgi:hypothetical protein
MSTCWKWHRLPECIYVAVGHYPAATAGRVSTNVGPPSRRHGHKSQRYPPMLNIRFLDHLAGRPSADLGQRLMGCYSRAGSIPAPCIQTWEWPLLIPGFPKAAGPVSARSRQNAAILLCVQARHSRLRSTILTADLPANRGKVLVGDKPAVHAHHLERQLSTQQRSSPEWLRRFHKQAGRGRWHERMGKRPLVRLGETAARASLFPHLTRSLR